MYEIDTKDDKLKPHTNSIYEYMTIKAGQTTISCDHTEEIACHVRYLNLICWITLKKHENASIFSHFLTEMVQVVKINPYGKQDVYPA